MNKKNKNDPLPKHPAIRAILEWLPQMPEYVAEKKRKAAEIKSFRKKVWEKACRDAGLID